MMSLHLEPILRLLYVTAQITMPYQTCQSMVLYLFSEYYRQKLKKVMSDFFGETLRKFNVVQVFGNDLFKVLMPDHYLSTSKIQKRSTQMSNLVASFRNYRIQSTTE